MKILILYGTEAGTTAYVADAITAHLTKQGHQVDTFDAAKADVNLKIETYDLLFFGSPTYAEGQLASSMAFYLSNFNPKLEAKKTAVISLGDRTFSHFCASAEIIEGWIKDHGGTLVAPALKIDGYPYDTTDITTWVDQVIAKL